MAGFIGIEQALVIPDWKPDTSYFIGVVVSAGDSIYRCIRDHQSGDQFLAYNWQGISAGGDGVPRLFEIVKTLTIDGGSSIALELDATMNKYDIRTVYCSTDKQGEVQVSIYEKAVDGLVVYKSLSQPMVYDIANVPCEDKDGTGKLHAVINYSLPAQTKLTLRIKLTNLS